MRNACRPGGSRRRRSAAASHTNSQTSAPSYICYIKSLESALLRNACLRHRRGKQHLAHILKGQIPAPVYNICAMALTFLEFCNPYHNSAPAAAAALPNVTGCARPGHLSLAERVTAGMGACERVSVCAWSCRGAAGTVECVRVHVCACIAAALCASLCMRGTGGGHRTC